MPKRTDIKSILIIGAGPIVIGQACEFDYSGAQACKALREEGYRVILVNSNPATIMTDPDMADATYIEPITWQMVEKIIAKERPDALLPTMGGQTALNCALDLAKHGVLEKYGVEMIGAIERGHRQGRRPREIQAGDEQDRPGLPRVPRIAHSLEEALQVQAMVGFPDHHPAVLHAWAARGGGIAYNREEFVAICERGLEASPTHELLIEESLIGWKEFEMEVVRDTQGQLHHHLLDREPRPDGRAHRRLDHRGAGADADRQGIPDHAQRLASRCCARSAWIPAAPTCSSRINPEDGRMVVIEMNPRVSRSSALASKATGFPIAKVAAKLAVGYTLDELQNDITGGATPASFEPTIDYVVTKIPRFAFEKFPQADDRLTTQMKSVGEVMAIGRTFQESLQKALRGLEVGVDGLDEKTTDREAIEAELGDPGPERIWYVGDAFRVGMSLDEMFSLTAHRSVVPGADRGYRRAASRSWTGAAWMTSTRDELRELKRKGFSDRRLAKLLAHRPARGARAAPRAGRAPGLQARGYLRRRVRHRHRLHVLDLRGGVRGAADRQEKDHGAGRRAEPHRPGHRVRLLLRACRAGAARGRLRDHHGQLQSGDRFHRLRHLRPPVFRAADAGRRAGNRRTWKSRSA